MGTSASSDEEQTLIGEEETLDEENPPDEEITPEELGLVLKQLKNGKSPGEDRITAEMFKYMGENAKRLLLELINKAWKEGKTPEEWHTALILPIFKKGDKGDCKNYRGITLINTIMKTIEKVIDNRLRTKLDHKLAEPQSGFRRGRSIQDHIFSIKQLIEKMDNKDSQIYASFIDMEKAFDMVPRQKVWDILKTQGVGRRMLSLIEKIYNDNNNAVLANNRQSEYFKTRKGLRQGGSLSPLLFIIYMDKVIKKCSEKTKKVDVGYRFMKTVKVSEGAFADDIIVIAKTEQSLQDSLNKWNHQLKEEGMRVNIEKTKVMIFGKQEELTIKIDNTLIEQVNNFKYLGVELSHTGTDDSEINNRITQSQKLYQALKEPIINRKEVTKKTKVNVYKTIYRPVLTFGCETWNLSKAEKSRIQAVEMRYLRRVKGITKRDRIRNEIVRDELDVESILDFIERRQLSWWGHLQRMQDTRQVKEIWEAKQTQKSRRGRPRKTWNHTLNEILIRRGTTWCEAKKLAKDKQKWANFVHGQGSTT